MDQGMIDWTAFLTDDAWFLPDPPPAGAELVPAPPDDVDTGLPRCAQHPDASSDDCCWRRALLDSRAVGFEEQVATLGHFGMGFPEGCYPETVPGSFTATQVEWGRPSSVLDDNILDMAKDREDGDGFVLHVDDRVETEEEDEWQSEVLLTTPKEVPMMTPDEVLLTTPDEVPMTTPGEVTMMIPGEVPLTIPDPVQVFPTRFDLLELATVGTDEDVLAAPPTPTEEHAVYSESVSDPDEARVEPTTPVACPAAIVLDECAVYQDLSEHEVVQKPSRCAPKENDDGAPGLFAEIAQEPKKYQRKRKMHRAIKSAEFIENSEEDSDWMPDSRKKKRAKTTVTPTPTKPAAATKKPRKPRGPQVWFSKSSKPRIAPAPVRHTERPSTPATGTDQTALGEYAPFANEAQFAMSAKRARFALEATTTRRQPGVRYGDAEDAQHAYARLQEDFHAAKKQAASGSRTSRNIQQVVFADKAGDALFAMHAIAAEVLIKFG